MEKRSVWERVELDGCVKVLESQEIKDLLEQEVTASDERPLACPHCGGVHLVKRGRDRDGTQRWLCRGCRRTFTLRTDSPLRACKLSLSTWDRFVDGMFEGLTLKELAERCGVCQKTSWYMKQRILALVGS